MLKLLFLILIITLGYSKSSCPVKTYIPVNAKDKLLPLYIESNNITPKINELWYYPALIEHESCVRLCGNNYWARRCWSAKSRLKTYWDKAKTIPREEGAGLGQLTRTFKRDGRPRWDMLETMRKKHPKELHELNWINIYDRPDLQMKALILLWKSNFDRYPKTINKEVRMEFADSAYNGGNKYLLRERKECKLRKECNPDIWFNNVELMNARGNRKLYGDRTAHDINRHHVKDVFKNRMPKYKKDFFNIKSCPVKIDDNNSENNTTHD